MTHPTPGAQRCLRTIYNVNEDGLENRRIRLRERMHLAGPTVTQMINRLERDGYVRVGRDQRLTLTPAGETIAIITTRKHRLAERLLVDILGVSAAAAHEEACRLEHTLSDDAERGIIERITNPTVSVWGNPIPGLGMLGIDAPPPPATVPLTELRTVGIYSATIRSISEDAQDDPEFIAALVSAGIIPNAQVRIEVQPHGHLVRGLNKMVIATKRSHVLSLNAEVLAHTPPRQAGREASIAHPSSTVNPLFEDELSLRRALAQRHDALN